MEQIKNRYGLAIEPGEFVQIQKEKCHILSYIENWEDAPAGTSGYRGVSICWLFIDQKDLKKRLIDDGSFAELESEYKQYFEEEPMTQNSFDHLIDAILKSITLQQFIEGLPNLEDGIYFVRYQDKSEEAAPSAPTTIGKKIRIIDMKGEPQYAGKEGVVTHIDDAGQIHGTWGGCALVEGDRYEFIDNDEEGKLPKEAPKTKYWSVPVVYEMYGSISVEAESAEEAYNKVKDHPEEFGLPEEGFYVDDSFKVADDDRENAIGTIKMLDDAPADDAASGRHTGLTVKATVTFQKWEGDIARFNGEAEFDACDALDSMSDEELAQIERNDPYALDNVYLRAVAFGQIHDYDGPFEVDLDEDNLSDYLEARREAQ